MNDHGSIRQLAEEAARAWEAVVQAARESTGAARRLLEVPERLQQQDEQLQAVRGQLEDACQKLQSLEEALAQLRADVARCQEAVEAQAGQEADARGALDELHELLGSLRERVAALEDTVRRHLEAERESLSRIAEAGGLVTVVVSGPEGGSHAGEQPERSAPLSRAVAEVESESSALAPGGDRESWVTDSSPGQVDADGDGDEEDHEQERGYRTVKEDLEDARRLLRGERRRLWRLWP